LALARIFDTVRAPPAGVYKHFGSARYSEVLNSSKQAKQANLPSEREF